MVKIIACKTTEIVSGQMKKITVGGKEIIVSNVDGNYLTLSVAGAKIAPPPIIKI